MHYTRLNRYTSCLLAHPPNFTSELVISHVQDRTLADGPDGAASCAFRHPSEYLVCMERKENGRSPLPKNV